MRVQSILHLAHLLVAVDIVISIRHIRPGMSDEPSNDQKAGLSLGVAIALGAGIGTALGVAVGAAFGNVAMGAAFGPAIGAGIGVAVGVVAESSGNSTDE